MRAEKDDELAELIWHVKVAIGFTDEEWESLDMHIMAKLLCYFESNPCKEIQGLPR